MPRGVVCGRSLACGDQAMFEGLYSPASVSDPNMQTMAVERRRSRPIVQIGKFGRSGERRVNGRSRTALRVMGHGLVLNE